MNHLINYIYNGKNILYRSVGYLLKHHWFCSIFGYSFIWVYKKFSLSVQLAPHIHDPSCFFVHCCTVYLRIKLPDSASSLMISCQRSVLLNQYGVPAMGIAVWIIILKQEGNIALENKAFHTWTMFRGPSTKNVLWPAPLHFSCTRDLAVPAVSTSDNYFSCTYLPNLSCT